MIDFAPGRREPAQWPRRKHQRGARAREFYRDGVNDIRSNDKSRNAGVYSADLGSDLIPVLNGLPARLVNDHQVTFRFLWGDREQARPRETLWRRLLSVQSADYPLQHNLNSINYKSSMT